MYDDHKKPHFQLTHAQASFFLSCLVAFLWWFLRSFNGRSSHAEAVRTPEKEEESEAETGLTHAQKDGEGSGSVNVVAVVAKATGGEGSDVEKGDSGVMKNDVKEVVKKSSAEKSAASFRPVPTVDEVLKDVVVFGLVMFYFLLCDYVKILPNEERVYSRDLFLFLMFLLLLVACTFTVTPTTDKILNRDQTEEWKGWMQVASVWYHYFAAKEWYNIVRNFMACYVWMTGFGNFCFFWIRGDYSLWRVLKMLFRLNFLVVAIMAVTANEYMLYYICAMHTYWFLSVYFFMRVLSSWNTHRWKMAAKFVAYFLANALIFEIPGNCSRLFRPLWFIFQFHDGVHDDIMHEWEFRAGLDHWACFLGMLCAYNYPHYEAFIKYLESSQGIGYERWKRVGLKIALVGGSVLIIVAVYFAFMRQEKLDYNRTHCYTSLVVVLVIIVLRNAFPVLRRYYINLFAWLGKITLETYLSQLHVYLQSNAKHLLGYLRGYPLLNLALGTVIYLGISHLLFRLTVNFSAFFIQKDWRKAARLSATACCVIFAAFVVSVVMKNVPV